MIHVRRHKRQTASGKTVTVTAHEREGGSGRDGDIVRPAPEWSQPEYVGDIQPAPVSRPADSDWWADDDQAARDSVTYGEPVDKSDIRAWTSEITARDAAVEHTIAPSHFGTPYAQQAQPWKEASKAERDRRLAELREARDELERVSRRDRYESEAFLDANDRVIEAEKRVPRWRW